MKKVLLLIVLLMGVCSISLKAQNRIHRVESDGFEWYQVYSGEKRGATTTKGKTIIPTEFTFICYHSRENNKGYFTVRDGNNEGAYEKDGTYVIPTSRGYTSVTKQDHDNGDYYTVKRNDYVGACDANGREIIAPQSYTSVCRQNDKGVFYYTVKRNDYEGACDANGREIIAPQSYTSVCRHTNNDGSYYGVERNGKEGACDASGREIIAPQYESLIYSSSDHAFNYKNSSGEWVNTGIPLNGGVSYASSSSASSTSSSVSQTAASSSQIVKKTMMKHTVIKEDGSKIEFNDYLIENDHGRKGIMSLDGKIIVPMQYDFATYDIWGGGYRVEDGDKRGIYTLDGINLISTSRGYTDITFNSDDEDDFPEQNKYGWYYYVEKGEGNAGICDLTGREILSPGRGYDEVGMYKSGGIPFIVVYRNEKQGICTIDGREIVAPIYTELGITNNNTFMYRGADGLGVDLYVRPDGSRYERTYASSAPRRKSSWLGVIGRALVAGLAAGATAYVQAQQAIVPRVSAYRPATMTSTYSASTSYYTSPAYLAQVQARADQSMNNFHAQMQRIGQQALLSNQHMINRSRNMFGEMTSWSLGFTRDNGREPTELEKSEWVRQHYPDLYSSYIQAQSSGSSSSSVSSSGSSSTSSTSSTTRRTKCPNCNNGQRVYDTSISTVRFGLEPKMKRCDICGKSYDSSSTAHRHDRCDTCHGSGYLD